MGALPYLAASLSSSLSLFLFSLKVFICMTVTVDYNWLPLGKEAVYSVQQSFPEVQCGFDLPAGLCTLSGRFSVVQAIVAQLVGFLEKPPISEKPARQVSSLPDLGGLGQLSPKISPYRTLEGSSGTNRKRAPRVEPPLENYDHSLIVDIDTFRYLQKHRKEEYERILRRRGVEALDMTRAGVTTLILQAKEGQAVREGDLREARRDLSRLCQEMESRLCREQLLKECGPREGLQQALEVLQDQLPRLLLGEDGKHISIVGSSSDVMEAKRFLLDLRADEDERLSPRLGGRLEPALNASRLDASAGKKPTAFMGGSPEGGRLRDIQSRVYGQDKLLTGLGNTLLTPTSAFSASSALKELSFARKQWSGSGFSSLQGNDPVFGSGQIFGKERQRVGVGGLTLEEQRTFGPTGQDIPLEKLNPPSALSLETRPFLASALIGSGLSNEKLWVGSSPITVEYMDLFGGKRVQSATAPPSESGLKTTLRRANSFSGFPRNKTDQKMGEASVYREQLSRGRTSAPGISREEPEVYSVEASTVMWEYMKEAYRTRLEDIISGSQLKESESDSGVTTITLRGAEPSRLDICQQELQKMVSMVATDFVVQELPLARLGVADPQDETLEICCDEVRKRFQKVKIQKGEESLVVIGPEQLCTQVVGALEEVFQDGAERRRRRGRERPPGAAGTLDTSLTIDNLDQSSGLVSPDGSQEEAATQREKERGPSTDRKSVV